MDGARAGRQGVGERLVAFFRFEQETERNRDIKRSQRWLRWHAGSDHSNNRRENVNVRGVPQTTGGAMARHGACADRRAGLRWATITILWDSPHLRCDVHYGIPRQCSPRASPVAPHDTAVNFSPTQFPSRDSVREGAGPVASGARESAIPSRSLQRDALLPVEAVTQVVRMTLGVSFAAVGIAPDDGWASRFTMSTNLAPAADALFGLDVPLLAMLASEVHRTGSTLVIEDTRAHPLVRGAPVVRGQRMLSCLAVPLRDASGCIHGALFALDGVPRWWTEADVTVLAHLALAATTLLASAVGSPTLPARQEPAPPALVPESGHADNSMSASTFASTILETLTEGVLVLDDSWIVRSCNAAAAKSLGVARSDLHERDVRQALASIVDAAVLAAWQRAYDARRTTSFTWHHQLSGRWFEGTAVPGSPGLTISVRDTTLARSASDARVRRTAQTSEAKKLEAIGLLAGGVAHDFNNLLTVIAANTELLQQLPVAVEAVTEISEIQRAAARASDLTRQLLAFSGQQLLEPREIEVNQIIASLGGIVRRLLPVTVQVETSLTTQPTTVHIDVAQLEQVIVNLVTNARDAMPDGGVLQLATSRRLLDELLSARPAPIPPGQWVVLSVRDTGTGIPPQVIDRVFEPFFTTRDVGAGTGLGLATAYGIVTQSGGRCTVESAVGHGTTFELWLPARPV